MSRPATIGLLVLGILGISTAALWIRQAGTPEELRAGLAGELAFRRLALSVPLLAVWVLGARVPVWPRRVELPRLLLAGLLLAGHFHCWTASLAYLPTATATLLGASHPVIVLLFELLRGHFPRGWRGIGGVALAVAGTALLVGLGDDTAPARSLVGLGYAVGGSVCIAGYLLAGRSLRQTMAASSYGLGVYTVAAVVLGLFQALLAGGTLIPGDAAAWRIALLLAVFPIVLGHTPMNAALRVLPATVVSTAFLGEVVGASLLVWLFAGERVPADFWLGGGLVAAGIVAVTYAGRRPAAAPRPGAPARRARPRP